LAATSLLLRSSRDLRRPEIPPRVRPRGRLDFFSFFSFPREDFFSFFSFGISFKAENNHKERPTRAHTRESSS
jgi:hypothetical protein